MERSSMELIVKLLREIELRIVRLECRIEAVEARLREVSEDMRKILERCERRRWLA
ncbi:MAG: hypothetical protein QW512_01510 [Thermofilaceae archaeon]